MADNTFLGLQPYTEEDADRFKGRTEESQTLFRMIVRNDYTVCYADSGEGKTSLLNAGVFPLLRENMYFPIQITFTDDDYKTPPDCFDAIIDRCINDSIDAYNNKNTGFTIQYRPYQPDFLGQDKQEELQQALQNHSWWKLRNYRPQAMGLVFTPVFVFDQFEEVFNMPGSIVWTNTFFKWLEEVSSDRCPDHIIERVRSIIGPEAAFPVIKEEKGFKAIFSLRKEFMGELDYWGMQQCFIPALKDNRYCLKPLTYDGAEAVMRQQAQFDENKIKEVLNFFVRRYSKDPEKTKNLPIIPALLLSVVCDSWERDPNAFSGKDKDELGQSLNAILEKFYDERLNAIISDLGKRADGNNKPEQWYNDIEEALFALIDVNGKRVRTKTTSPALLKIDFDKKYKEILTKNRLIKISRVEDEDYVEIVHDALCPVINKRKGIKAKKQEEERLREQAKKMRKRMFLISIIALLVIGGAAWIILEMRQREEKMLINQSRFIAEKASALVDEGNPYLAQRLLLEVLPENLDNPNRPYTVEAEQALRNIYIDYTTILHVDHVITASFSPDGKKIVSASYDNTVRIWDAETGKELNVLKGHTGEVESTTFSPDGKRIVSASWDKTVRIWNAETGKELKVLKGHTGWVNSASFSPDGKKIVSASNDKTVRIWDAETGKELKSWEEFKFSINLATFSPDGNKIILVLGGGDYTISIWDVETGMEQNVLEGHTNSVCSASFSPDGKKIISSSLDKTIRIWDAETGNELNVLEGHTDGVTTASFSSDGERIVSSSVDKSIKIWDAQTGKELNVLEGHTDYVMSAYFSPDGQRIVSASGDNSIRIWAGETEKVLKGVEGIQIFLNIESFSPDGKRFVSASSDNTVRIWNMETGKTLKVLEGHVDTVYTASFSPDGKKVVSASQDNTIRIWDAEKGKELNVLEGHTNSVCSASFSPDGKRIVSASLDKTIRIWDAETGKELDVLEGHTDGVTTASFSSDGERIVSSSVDKSIKIWDAQTGKELNVLEGHTDFVISAYFSPDGQRIVSASGDKTIGIWDAETGEELIVLGGHTNFVMSASYSPDGKRIVSSSLDKTIRIWDVETGMLLKIFEEPNYVISASFRPDGKKIISTTVDGTIRIKNYPPLQELIDQTRERFKDYPLTPEERRMYYLE